MANNRIVSIRKEKGITQKQLSELTGIPIQTVVRYEKGGTITAGRLGKIALALGVRPSELLDLEPIKYDLSKFTTQELLDEIERRCGE